MLCLLKGGENEDWPSLQAKKITLDDGVYSKFNTGTLRFVRFILDGLSLLICTFLHRHEWHMVSLQYKLQNKHTLPPWRHWASYCQSVRSVKLLYVFSEINVQLCYFSGCTWAVNTGVKKHLSFWLEPANLIIESELTWFYFLASSSITNHCLRGKKISTHK